MKNILVISCSIIYQDARVKSYIQSLKNHGYSISVISLKENDSDPLFNREDGYINYMIATRYIGDSLVSYIRYYLLFAIRCFFLVSKIALRERLDVVHYNNLPNFPVFAALIPRIRGASIILDNHDLIGVMFTSKFSEKKAPFYLRAILGMEQKLSMNFAHRIITADHNQKTALVEDGIPEEKIDVFLNLANTEWFKPQIKAVRSDNEFRLIYHGTIAERLGIDLAIKAVAKARDFVPNLKFYLIGKGDFLKECLDLIEGLGLEENVLPSNCYYPVTSLPEIIGRMDVGIIPNRRTPATDRFMLPVKLLEYVQMGLPVIVPRLNIIENYFSDGMLMFFEPGDSAQIAECIIKLYESKDLREKLVNNSKGFISEHNWERQDKDYIHMIESLYR